MDPQEIEEQSAPSVGRLSQNEYLTRLRRRLRSLAALLASPEARAQQNAPPADQVDDELRQDTAKWAHHLAGWACAAGNRMHHLGDAARRPAKPAKRGRPKGKVKHA